MNLVNGAGTAGGELGVQPHCSLLPYTGNNNSVPETLGLESGGQINEGRIHAERDAATDNAGCHADDSHRDITPKKIWKLKQQWCTIPTGSPNPEGASPPGCPFLRMLHLCVRKPST